jgi:FkbM family methyltransferase
MLNVLKKFAQHPLIFRLSTKLKIRGVLRGMYRSCFAPEGGTHAISVGGRHARFYVYSKTGIEVLDSLGGEREMLEYLMGKLTAGDCFYDIGAATGLYTVFLAQVVGEQGQVVSFEPEVDSYERLVENLKLNHLGNVQPIRAALGELEEMASLAVGGVAGAGRIVKAGDNGDKPVRVERVNVVHGDRFIEGRGLPIPRAIKIDVEGQEYAVIQGLSRTLSQPACHVVCCEIHKMYLPESVKPEDVLALLRSLGFGEIKVHSRAGDLHACAMKSR